MWYQNIGSMFFRFVTKHASDGQNYDPQGRASIIASRGKKTMLPARVLMLAISAFFRRCAVQLVQKLFVIFSSLCSLLGTGNTAQVKAVQDYYRLSSWCMKLACSCRSSSSNFCPGSISETEQLQPQMRCHWRRHDAHVCLLGVWLIVMSIYRGSSPKNAPKRPGIIFKPNHTNKLTKPI